MIELILKICATVFVVAIFNAFCADPRSSKGAMMLDVSVYAVMLSVVVAALTLVWAV